MMKLFFEKNPVAVVRVGKESATTTVKLSTLESEDKECLATADTGAGACLIGQDMFDEMFPDTPLAPPLQTLVTVGGAELKQSGVFMGRFEIEGNVAVAVVHVSEDVEGLYLSLCTCKDLSLVHELFPRPFKTNNKDVKFSSFSASPSHPASTLARACLGSLEYRLLRQSGSLDASPTAVRTPEMKKKRRQRGPRRSSNKLEATKAESSPIRLIKPTKPSAHAQKDHVTKVSGSAQARAGHVTTTTAPLSGSGRTVINAVKNYFRYETGKLDGDGQAIWWPRSKGRPAR